MGRIKTFVLLGAVFSTFLMLSGCGNTLLADVESRVNTAKSITIDFHYDGPYELSKDYPIYLRILPNPLDDRLLPDDPNTYIKLADKELEKSSTVVIPVSSLYPSESGKYFAFIIHDLNNNGIDSEDGSDDFVFVNNGTNNCGDIPEDDIIHDGHFHTLPDANLMSVGEKYAINFNLEVDTNDIYEPDNSYNKDGDILYNGDSHDHQLGWGDVDYIELSSTGGNYTVTVDSYQSTIPIDIGIVCVQNGTLCNFISNEPKTKADMPFTITTDMSTSYGQFYLRVGTANGSNNNAMGYYTVSFVKN